MLGVGNLTQFLHDADVQLPDPLLGDAQFLADLIERTLTAVLIQTGPQFQNLPFAWVQVFEQSIHLLSRQFGALETFLLVGRLRAKFFMIAQLA